jgi:hypothetical protein
MKTGIRHIAAAVTFLALAGACGPGGALPPANGSGPAPSSPTTPSLPGPGNQNTLPPLNTSLWPLGTGSRWKYQITDPDRGVFEKSVSVEGVKPMPGGGEAIQLRSVQPHLEELSWQQEADGRVVRLREEDRKGGELARVTTWTPGTLKSISAAQAQGWSFPSKTQEVETYPDGSILSSKEKTYVWTVTAVDEEVTVPAGTFKTIRVTRTRPDEADYLRVYWLAPGIGKVKEDGQRLEELMEYEVKW